jgi:hypothetical protein
MNAGRILPKSREDERREILLPLFENLSGLSEVSRCSF